MQVETGTGRAPMSRPATSLYLMTWVAVAAFGMGYIGIAATRPDLLGAILPISEPAADNGAFAKSRGELTDEIAALRKWVHEVQHELAATRSTMQEQVAHSGAIVQRLAAAEERLSTLQEVQDALVPAGRSPLQRVQTRAQIPPAPPRVAQTLPPANVAPEGYTGAANAGIASLNVINGAASSITTGSVPETRPPTAASAPTFGPAKVVPAPANPRAIEIGSGESLDSLRAKWGELSSRDSQTLGTLSPRYRLAADSRSAPFTLLAGPFNNPAEATKACTALRARGIACRVGAFGGNSL